MEITRLNNAISIGRSGGRKRHFHRPLVAKSHSDFDTKTPLRYSGTGSGDQRRLKLAACPPSVRHAPACDPPIRHHARRPRGLGTEHSPCVLRYRSRSSGGPGTDHVERAGHQHLHQVFSRDSDLTTSVVRPSVSQLVSHQNPKISINQSLHHLE